MKKVDYTLCPNCGSEQTRHEHDASTADVEIIEVCCECLVCETQFLLTYTKPDVSVLYIPVNPEATP